MAFADAVSRMDAAVMRTFGESVSVAGVPRRAVVNLATELVVDGVVTLAPTAMLRWPEATGITPQTMVQHAGIDYVVRQIDRASPDGQMARLVLARA